MMENLGCKGTQARADCRAWNGSGSCLTRLSLHQLHRARVRGTRPRLCETPKISGIPIGLPTDMPKAWFVALASLSKAATPRRLKENAAAPAPWSCRATGAREGHERYPR
jgi:hypothetical protein